jgi:hypothetical protein
MPREGDKRRWIVTMATFGVGSGISSAAVGIIVSSISIETLSASMLRPGFVVVCLLALGLALGDLARRDQWAIGFRRQTDPKWRRFLGSRWAAALWGLDLGLGFTTFRVTSTFWILIAAVAVERSVVSGLIVLLCYSAGQTAAILMGQRTAVNCDSRPLLNPNLPRRLRIFSACALAVWCGIALVFGVV